MPEIRKHLTYANVMSTLAVFLLLGSGVAVAAKKRLGTNAIKAGAITAGKLRNKAVTARKLRDGSVGATKLADGSVGATKLAAGAVTGEHIAAAAVTGDKVVESSLSEVPSAASANPVAFAKVHSNGVVDAALSKGITSPNVSRPGTGVYCVSVPSFAARGAQATTQSGAAGSTAQVTVGGTASCPFPSVQVLTWSAAAAAADVAFYVALYR